ncbi:MAG: ester cyclase [Pseudomonadota bacterium]
MHARDLKNLLAPFRVAAENFETSSVAAALAGAFAPDARLSCCHPFGELTGADEWQAKCLTPLHAALPDLERRDLILLAGTTPEGQHWIGAMGNYLGTFRAPFLDIPPTGGLVHMRYHEFFRVENNQVVAAQVIWDLPELMMQARAWPLAPQLGAFLCTPAPMTGDGLTAEGDGRATMDHVLAMLTDLLRHPDNPNPAVMNLERYWHPRVNWYGPAGIGTARGIAGFRHWHQIPFLKAMPNRGLDDGVGLMSHWVAEGSYVCETGWPNMRMTLSDDGWMGIAPPGKPVSLRSLDFWRLENGLIRENWVLVDLLDLYQQIGVDVLARVRDFNKARNLSPIATLDPLG